MAAVALAIGAASAGATDVVNGAYALSHDEVRQAAAIQSYRLEKAYYDHLRRVARVIADSRGVDASRPVSIDGIDEPARPQVRLPATDLPRRGPPDAAVRIVVIENLSQIYSQRLDRALDQLSERYGTRIAVYHRDFVDPTHRNSLAAAVAARCARTQGEFWAYRSLLLGHLDDQSPSHLLSYAKSLALDARDFERCLDDARRKEAVLEETAAARARGITVAPVLLINDRYAAGVESPDVFDGLIAAALPEEARARTQDLPETSLDLALTGVAFFPGAARQAMIVSEGHEHGRIYVVGDHVRPDVVITAVLRDHVVLHNQGRAERLTLGRGAAARAEVPPDRMITPDISDRALVTTNVSTIHLDEDDVQRLLVNRDEMEAAFAPAELDVGEGRRLLKIMGDAHGPSFARLGLQHKDVLLRVNDEFVYDGRNTLFDSIAERRPTTIVLIRRGISRLVALDFE